MGELNYTILMHVHVVGMRIVQHQKMIAINQMVASYQESFPFELHLPQFLWRTK